MRPVRECSEEREKTEQTWDPIQTLSLAASVILGAKMRNI